MHILNASHAFTGMLLSGMDDLTKARPLFAKFAAGTPASADGATIAAALRASIEERHAELGTQTPEWFAGMITRFDGQRVTRLEMVQFLKEHEITHRQQLFLYMRLKGLVPVTTRRRQAQQAGR